MQRRLVPLAILLSATSAPASAAEGMWQPRQLPAIAERLSAAGYRDDPAAIADLARYPMDAVVAISGCSASFVSPQGLVATNHHCAYGTIQYNSTGERNLLRDGFLAADLAAELPGDPNQRVWVTDRITDVSAQVRRAVGRARDSRSAWDAYEGEAKRLVRACESEGPYRCEIYTFHGGAEFNLIRQLEIKDVRLVYAPAGSIGKYGGDIDNWMWPRHTGDFAFLRAYVAPDGRPAPYAKENVPYRPKSFLRIDADGVAEGEYVMVAGYPGRTNRWRLAEELDDAIGWSMPTLAESNRELIRIIEDATRGRPDAAVRYAAALAGLNNTMKNIEGQLEGFRRGGGVAAKRAREAAWLARIDARGDADARSALDALRAELARARERRERDLRFGLIAPPNLPGAPRFNREGSPVAAAIDLYRLALERRRPDARREAGYQLRDEPRIRARLEMFERRFDEATDRALFEHRLRRYAALPAQRRVPELDAWLGIRGDAPDLSGLPAKLDAFYAGLTLDDRAQRLALLDAPPARIEASGDSALSLAVALLPALQRIEAEAEAQLGAELRLRTVVLESQIAFEASQGRVLYPDANASLRVTYGNVVGYRPRDGVQHLPFTTLAGVAAKATGVDPFDAPPAQLQAIAAGRGARHRDAALGDVPVNFLADLDITGGNSGSPTLNADGELVGLVFDGNWESVSSNWVFDAALTRSIHVDIRYMLWVMSEVDHADHLLRELSVAPGD
jgi:hypothetical protein